MSSHDLKSPLRTLMSFSQLLSSSAKDKLNDEELEYLNFIQNGAETMNELIQKILEYSKFSFSEKSEALVSVEEVLDELKNDMQADIQSSNCKLVTNSLDEKILCDKLRIKQLFQNLISNAIKFRKSDQDLVVEISQSMNNGICTYLVKDNGIGFNNKYNKEIFKMFKKLNGQEEYKGSGLGLSICQQIVHQHNGQIWAESEIGIGSNIYFTLSQSSEAATT